jgi:hypothetical protein
MTFIGHHHRRFVANGARLTQPGRSRRRAETRGPAFARSRIMRHVALALCLLSATACQEKSPTAPTPVDREVVLAPGESTAVTSDLTLRFVGVPADSRCPADALCIHLGDAIVRIHVDAGATQAERELHTSDRKPVSVEGLRVELVQLAPYPFSSGPIQPGDYRATLRVAYPDR